MVKNTKTKAKYFYDDFYKTKRYEQISTDEYLVDYIKNKHRSINEQFFQL